MPKPINATIGQIVCPHCDGQADVRRDKRQRLYYHCGNCGTIRGATAKFQSWLLDRASLHNPAAAKAEPDRAPLVPRVERRRADSPGAHLRAPGAEGLPAAAVPESLRLPAHVTATPAANDSPEPEKPQSKAERRRLARAVGLLGGIDL